MKEEGLTVRDGLKGLSCSKAILIRRLTWAASGTENLRWVGARSMVMVAIFDAYKESVWC
jgi:hypothetical protein